MNNTYLKAIIGGMFTLLLAMLGYLVTQNSSNTEHNDDAVMQRINVEAERISRTNERANDLDRRLAVVESRVDDLRKDKP